MENEVNIDSMSKEQLEASLRSAVNELDGKAEAEPVIEPVSKPEPEQVEAETKVEADDTSKGDEGEQAGDDEGNPYRKRIDRLLRKRDTLTETLAEKDKRIAELEAKVSAPKDSDEDDSSNDLPSVLNKVLDDRDRRSKTEIERSKITDEEFNKLLKIAPNATKRKGEILELADKYPTLTFEAIDRILAPADHIDPIEANRKNARRMDVSSRSRADLESEKDITKASPAEQEKYLREQIASGKLVI